MKNKIEIAVHVIFWIFMMSAINVDWSSDWFDQSIRQRTPAPLSVLIFPIYFYVNAFILIPKYFSIKKWKHYALFAFILFIVPEMIRVGFYLLQDGDLGFEKTLFNRDSFLFGSPSAFFLALNTSFIYRLSKDWLSNKDQESNIGQKKTAAPYENSALLNDNEAKSLKQTLEHTMTEKVLFLNPELSLRELAESVQSTEKKVSYLINQHMNSNFYEWVNHYRVEKFKSEIVKEENKGLSIVGVALNCGFPSKSSFYRAFKSEIGSSPSEYLKKLGNPK